MEPTRLMHLFCFQLSTYAGFGHVIAFFLVVADSTQSQPPSIPASPDRAIVKQSTVPYVPPRSATLPTPPVATAELTKPQQAIASSVSVASVTAANCHVLVMPVISTGPEFQYPPADAGHVLLETAVSFCAAHPTAPFRIAIVELLEVSKNPLLVNSLEVCRYRV